MISICLSGIILIENPESNVKSILLPNDRNLTVVIPVNSRDVRSSTRFVTRLYSLTNGRLRRPQGYAAHTLFTNNVNRIRVIIATQNYMFGASDYTRQDKTRVCLRTARHTLKGSIRDERDHR